MNKDAVQIENNEKSMANGEKSRMHFIRRLHRRWNNSPVSLKFMTAALPFLALVVCLVFVANQTSYYYEEYSKLRFTQKNVSYSQTLLLATAMRDRETRTIKRILATIVSDPSFANASVVDLAGGTVAKVGNFDMPPDPQFEYSEPITYGDEIGVTHLGFLKTRTADSVIWEGIKTRMKLLPAIIFTVFVGFSLIFLFVYRWTIGKPLAAMVKTIDLARRTQNPVHIDPGSRDEMGQLAEVFNDHIAREWKNQQQLIITNENLERCISDRTRKLSEALRRANKARTEVTRLAMQDGLTDLPNRRQFVGRLEHIINAPESRHRSVAVMMLDLDRFKNVNDASGHGVGDMLLKYVADRLREIVPASDMVARLGGDEFAVAVFGVSDKSSVTDLADEIVARLNCPVKISDIEMYPGASIGISIYPKDGQTCETLMANADMAMFRAKDSGRGCYALYNTEMREAMAHADRIESELRKALDHGDLELFYQPKFQLSTGRVIGFEALSRWHHETLGSIAPGAFFPIAEDRGLILDVGRAVMKNASRDMSRWLALGLEPGTVAVNVHPVELRSHSHIAELLRTIEEHKLSFDRFVIEINEDSVVGRGTEQAVGLIGELRERGLTVSLDDFGTGYASLKQLKSLPFDEIKIDRSFIWDMTEDKSSEAIVRAIIDLALNLGSRVVAEGIETEEQALLLGSYEGMIGQGFLLGRPLRFKDATALIPARGDNQQLSCVAQAG